MKAIFSFAFTPLLCALFLNLAYPPFNISILAMFILVPLLSSLRLSHRHRFLKGWLAGFLLQATAFYWVFGTLQDFGGQSWFISGVGAFLFWAYHGLDIAIWLWLAPLALNWKRPVWQAISLASLWSVIQLDLFSYVFPWNMGAAFIGTPILGQSATLWGDDGTSFLVTAIGMTLALVRQQAEHRRWGWQPLLGILLMCVGSLIPLPAPDRELRVAVVQPNLIPWAKRDMQSSFEIFEAHAQPTRTLFDRVDLVVWPETALPLPLDQSPQYQDALQTLVNQLNVPLVMGTMGSGPDVDSYTNEIWLFAPDSNPQRYIKRKLVLFSEKLPWILSWAQWFDPNLGAFRPGNESNSLSFGELELIPLVCYEATLPRFVWQFQGNMIVNVTNDAWFGKTKASSQHLQLIRGRAVECGIPLIRATNSGISCWIDPEGKIHEPTALYESATPIYQVPYRAALHPSLQKYGGFALRLFYWLIASASIFLGWRNRRPQRVSVEGPES